MQIKNGEDLSGLNRWYKELEDLNLPQNFISQIEAYVVMLFQYSKIHSITNLKTKDEVLENVVDSVYPMRYFKPYPKRIADIGSGAGFPAIPLALAMPDTQFILYEPLAKKSAFLHWIKAELDVDNVKIKTGRIEEEREKYEFIVSRAVTNISRLLLLCQKCMSLNARLLLYKGSSVESEIGKNYKYEVHKRENRNYVILKEIVW